MSYPRSALLAGSMLLEIADNEEAWDLWLTAVARARKAIDADDQMFARWTEELGDDSTDGPGG